MTITSSIGDVGRFPVLGHGIFFDHASVTPLPAVVADAMIEQVQAWRDRGPEASGYSAIERVRGQSGVLFNVPAAEIAIVPNTSTGLAMVAAGLGSPAHDHPGLGAGDVVVTTANEFPSNRLVWEQRARDGCTVVVVPHDGRNPTDRDDWIGFGHIDDAAIVAAMREAFPVHRGTRLLAISHVQFATGQRHDIATLAEEAHRLGGLICVDAIQSAGQVPVDAGGWELDFVSADGHKWLLGPEGAGAFRVREDLFERLRPMMVGWRSVASPLEYDLHQPGVSPTATRYETGCLPMTNVNGFAAALDLILETGIDAIATRLAELNTRMTDRAKSAGLNVVSPPFGDIHTGHGSGIVSIAPPDPTDAQRIMLTLRDRSIRLSARRGLLRLSPHFYSTDAQADDAIDAVAALS